MNWVRIIADGIIMAAYFNLFAAFVSVYDPRIIMPGYPKSIQKATTPQTKSEKLAYHVWMYLGMLLPLMIYGSVSMASSEMSGFWYFVISSYIEWLIISFSDFFFLDIFCLKKLYPKMCVPGTEDCEGYQLKNWLKEVALLEHFVGWPFLMAPILAFAQGGLTFLFDKV